jgi:hypothetical protein
MLPGLEAAELPADAIEVGRILDAWGIKGWCKVRPYSADPEALFSSQSWFLLPTEKGVKTFDGVGLLKVKETKIHSVPWSPAGSVSMTAVWQTPCAVRASSFRAAAFPLPKKTSTTGST